MYIMSGSINVVEKLSELMKLFEKVDNRIKIIDEKNEELKGQVEKCNKQLEQLTASGANTERAMAEKINAAIDTLTQTIGDVSPGDDADKGAGRDKGDDADKGAGRDKGDDADKGAGRDKGDGTDEAGTDNGGMTSLSAIRKRFNYFIGNASSEDNEQSSPQNTQNGGGLRRNRGTKRKQKKDKRTTRRRRYTRGKK